MLKHEKKKRNEEKENAIKRVRCAEEAAKNRIKAIKQEANDRIAQMQVQADDRMHSELLSMRQQMEQRIRAERETIRADRSLLEGMSEKELMVECVESISSYAKRLDRVENRLSSVSMGIESIKRTATADRKPLVFSGVITTDDLSEIARKASKRIERITDISTLDAVVLATVITQNRLSTWQCEIDFNDNGRITGEYSISAENDMSGIPQRLAEEIRKEIIYRQNTQ